MRDPWVTCRLPHTDTQMRWLLLYPSAVTRSWSTPAPTPITARNAGATIFAEPRRTTLCGWMERNNPCRAEISCCFPTPAPGASAMKPGQRDVFEGVHDGYLRLNDPARHR